MEKIYKKEIQRLMPLFQAIAKGKTIQWNDMGVWRDIDGDDEGFFLDTFVGKTVGYRIKPESKYRPFANAEECWTEMQKHEPFGWVIKLNEGKILIGEVPSGGVVIHNQRGSMYGFDEANRILTFADGTPFGILEEE